MDRGNQVIRVLSAERFTPFALARKLNAVAMLESATFEGGRARYSLLLVKQAFRIRQNGSAVLYDDGTKRYSIKSSAKDILDVLLYFANQHQAPKQDFPFPAGGIGYLSYEFARHFDTIAFSPKEDAFGMPEAEFIFAHVMVVFDHYSDLIYLIGLNYREKQIDLEAALVETERAIGDLNFNYLQEDRAAYPLTAPDPDHDRDRYLLGVERVKEEIVAGNLLQGVLSRRVVVQTRLPAMEAYRRLRTANPAPYLVYLDFGTHQLFAASPEVHVKVKGDQAMMRPIAGTRPRGATDLEDKNLERELLADEKEGAEHLMLVDLCRNDLGRVCEPGTVQVTESRAIERYSRVMHIVSQVKGRLASGRTGVDAIRATFPAGTVSGAPKIRAIETIDGIEPRKRGFYAGIVAYLEPGGNLDSCITIRAALKRGDTLVLQAGAGIVFDSDPATEYTETGLKLSALARAIGLEVEQ